jgi:phage-related protein
VKKKDKPLAWLHGQVKTPPLSHEARIETGFLLRRLQQGERLRMPQSRPMPSIGSRCHELRIKHADTTWRLIYRIDPDAIVIAEVFGKKTEKTPQISGLANRVWRRWNPGIPRCLSICW